MKKLTNIVVILITIVTFLNCSPDSKKNNPVDFTLSNSEAVVYQEVYIEFDSSNEVDFFIDTPGSFQYEFSRYKGGSIGIYLTEIGTYRITQLGHNENYVEIVVYPNVVFWSDFQGNIITVNIEESVWGPSQQGSVNCVLSTPPSCADYASISCGDFAVPVAGAGSFYNYTATDGTNSWLGTMLLDQGVCKIISLSE